MQEMLAQSLGWEDPLEKEMATQSSILAWEIPWTEEAGGLQSMESQSRAWLIYLNNNNKFVMQWWETNHSRMLTLHRVMKPSDQQK